VAAEGAPDSCLQHVRLQLAWCLWHCTRGADAEAVYWDVLDEDVLCWQALVDRARMHLSRCSWGQALCDLAQVAAMGKADADVCNDLGVSHFESGDDEKAAHFFSEAIAKNDRHAPAISNRANCLKRQGKLREAEADYTRAIELDGQNPKAFMNRGLLLREQGLSTRAHRDFERALALDPSNVTLQAEVKALAEKLTEMGVAVGSGGGEGGIDQATTTGAGPLRRERL